ncbi:hypothetical protein NDU88_005133 [Pleurodeles waltl]|uniref:Uncharacterized protein n=1 Tax=Pleurodeles waltl TaxID=8319 RepID=A0AAV7WBV3_PLEWA|nr:hypothetical protein NDU88_005133 [Pleurodeles waltl]
MGQSGPQAESLCEVYGNPCAPQGALPITRGLLFPPHVEGSVQRSTYLPASCILTLQDQFSCSAALRGPLVEQRGSPQVILPDSGTSPLGQTEKGGAPWQGKSAVAARERRINRRGAVGEVSDAPVWRIRSDWDLEEGAARQQTRRLAGEKGSSIGAQPPALSDPDCG